jgi:bacillithiol biosynthesis cysteine-adding enzyme BshC
VGRAFSTSYLAGEPLASRFFAPTFFDAGARVARTKAAANRPVAPELLKVLADQQAALPSSPARQESWQALADGDAAAVVTGQQVGLFLGPLYSFYKAASAIAVARALQAEAGVRCVPVFWLQTEDHDFAEIRGATVADGEGNPVRLALADELGGLGRISVAHRSLPGQIDELVGLLAHALGEGQAAREVVEMVGASYRPGVGVAAAFAGLLARVFADEGLLIFNPRDARVAGLAAPSIRAFIEDAVEIEAALHEREAALTSAGFAVQVPIREQGALVFFHREGVEGPRHRIRRRQSEPRWTLSGSADVIAHDDLMATLVQDPMRFSTSALLRPIMQDTLFPTVAYVGGPGEINYFAQLGPLYARANLTPPLLVPRGRFCVVDARARRRLGQLGLSLADLASPEHPLRARLQGGLPEGAVSVEELRRRVAGEILPAVDQVATTAARCGVSLHRAAERTRKSVAHALDRLVDRYARELLERDAVTRRRLRDLELALFPEGIPQERFYAWPSLAGRIGARAFKDLIMQRLGSNPFATEVFEIHP